MNSDNAGGAISVSIIPEFSRLLASLRPSAHRSPNHFGLARYLEACGIYRRWPQRYLIGNVDCALIYIATAY